LEQIVHNVEQTEGQSGHARRRLAHLRETRKRAEADLRVLRELSELVPNDTWLQNLEINDNGAQMAGEAPAAAPLLGVLSGSKTLADAAFTSSLTKTPAGERFQISVHRRAEEASAQAPVAAAAPAAPNPAAPNAAAPNPATPAAPSPAAEQEGTLSTVSEADPAAAEESQ
jgi:hypothetical protein